MADNSTREYKYTTSQNCFWHSKEEGGRVVVDEDSWEYDLEPNNVMVNGFNDFWGGGSKMAEDYQLSGKLPKIKPGIVGKWTAWINKIQPDYRFQHTSEANTRANMFPEVESPWMFTQYIYKGENNDTDLIIRPELYDPETLELIENTDEDPHIGGHKKTITSESQKGVNISYTEINVSSTKWGQHGNIPANQINMTAPKKWIEPPGGTSSKLVPVITTYYGSPVLLENDKQGFYFFGTDDLPEQPHLQEKDMPGLDDSFECTIPSSNRNNAERIVISNDAKPTLFNVFDDDVDYQSKKGDGSYCHTGCEFLVKKNSTQYHCSSYDIATPEHKLTHIASSECLERTVGDAQCSHRVQKAPDLLGVYVSLANNKNGIGTKNYRQNETLKSNEMMIAQQMMMTPFGERMGMQRMQEIENMGDLQPDFNEDTNSIYHQVSYKSVETGDSSREVYKQDKRDYRHLKTKIVLGTGKFALDTEENSKVLEGGDTYAYGDINMLNHNRWLQNVLHCYDPASCKEMTSLTSRAGYDPAIKVGSDGKYCRYYNSGTSNHSGCPYWSIPRGAVEYQEMMMSSKALISVARSYMNNINSEDGIDGIAGIEKKDDIYLITNTEDKSNYFGIYGSDKSDGDDFITVRMKISEIQGFSGDISPSNPKYEFDSAYVSYMAVNNEKWCVKLDPNFIKADQNVQVVTNPKKFIGGWHLEYKNYSDHGKEFQIETQGSTFDLNVDVGAGQNGGSLANIQQDPNSYPYMARPTVTITSGIWENREGTWLTEEEGLGLKGVDVAQQPRELPNCLYAKFGNMNIDPLSDGEDALVVQPDPLRAYYEYGAGWKQITDYNKNKAIHPWRLDNEGEPWEIPVSGNFSMLPAGRGFARCTECDYQLNIRWLGVECPWCGTVLVITGDNGETEATKLPKTRAIGKVRVYGLPGTVIKKDAYFWKSLPVVNSALVNEIITKLGVIKETGGGTGFSEHKKEPNDLPPHKGKYVPLTEEIDKLNENKFKGVDVSNFVSYNKDQEKFPIERFTEFDNQYIAPYHTKEDMDGGSIGLQIISSRTIQALRNRLEPCFGYLVGAESDAMDYYANYYNYYSREESVKKAFNSHRTIPPQLMAANETGQECYVEFFGGDRGQGLFYEYYPPGPSWWVLEGVMGARRDNGEGDTRFVGCHMSTRGNAWHSDGKSYGKTTKAMPIYFLHGALPLNKEIEKAYAVIKPGYVPYKGPIGLPFEYGSIIYSHYHGQDVPSSAPQSKDNHLHGWVGGDDGTYFDMDGNERRVGDNLKATTMSEGTDIFFKGNDCYYHDGIGYPVYIKKTFHIEKAKILSDNNIIDNTVELQDSMQYPNPYEFTPNNWKHWPYSQVHPHYHSQFDLNPSKIFKEVPYTYALNWHGESDPWGYLEWDGYGTDFIQKQTDNRMWKNTTTEDMESETKRQTLHLSFGASNGKTEIKHEYDMLENQDQLLDQLQDIPGYFSYGNGYVDDFKITKPVYDTNWSTSGQVIIQSDKSYPSVKPSEIKFLAQSPSVGTGDTQGNTGLAPKDQIIDITGLVKTEYNDRVSRTFTARAGKTLQELFEEAIPKSQGDGIIDVDTLALWNDRILDGNLWLLNDGMHMPKMVGDDYPITDDSEYPLDLSNINKIGGTEESYEIILGINDAIVLTVNGEEKLSIIIEPETYTAQEVCDLINQSRDGYNFIDANGYIQLICEEKISTFKMAGSVLLTLGFNDDILIRQANRIINCSLSAEGQEPINIMKYKIESNKLKKTSTSKDIWFYESEYNSPQSFEVDLIQSPMEIKRRSYRVRKPGIVTTNCFCDNDDCVCNTDIGGPYTVSFYLKARGNIVSDQTTSCRKYETDFASDNPGIIEVDGDGIETYSYQEDFNQNIFIKKILCDPIGTDVRLTSFKCSYSISVKNTIDGIYKTILNVNYSQEEEKYIWFDKNTEYKQSSPPTEIVLEDYGYESLRGRYVKFTSFPNESYKIVVGTGTVEIGTNKFNLTGDWADELKNDELVGKRLLLGMNTDEYPTSIKIIGNIGSALVLEREFIVASEGVEEENYTNWKIISNVYRGGCAELDVYGKPYKDDFIITDPPIVEMFLLDLPGTYEYKLNVVPTQLLKVYIENIAGLQLVLTETDSLSGLFWETETVTETIDQEKIEYKKIISGKYFHDYRTDSIILPIKDNEMMMNNFEDELTNKSFMPAILYVECWTGMGTGVTLKAKANGQGPSYQVEKETITKIETELPEIGMSAKLKDGKKREIEWLCYNHNLATVQPSTTMNQLDISLETGYFRPPYFWGGEMGSNVGDVNWMKDFYGSNMSKVGGTVETELTFYGKPDTILSGSIQATAPAITKNEYNFNGNIVRTYERTGGLAGNGIVFSSDINASGMAGAGNNRETIANSLPYFVVYASERDLLSPLS